VAGRAQIAVNFVLNYEEGGERSVLHGDETSETRLTDLATAQPIRNERDLNMESAYEYGARVGVWRLLKIMADRRIPFTVYAVEAMAAAGCDFVDHGWRWIDYHTVDEETEREHIGCSVEVISRPTGNRPLGWYVGTPSPAARCLVVEEGGFLYDSDAYNDELPYWNHDYGRPHLIIPHTLDDNTRLARGLGWGQAGDFYTSLKDNFDALSAAGEEAPRMMTVAVHCRLAGKPGRAAAFARFIDYVLAHDRVWICHRLDIARHWRDHHPPSGWGPT
jgi:peptidoglycan/xylan/chitin deacetylase (PgdA/CDA1 family)